MHYRPEPFLVEPLKADLPLCAVYSGYKTPTAEVLAIMAKREQENPTRYASLYRQIGEATLQGVHALKRQDLMAFTKALKINQQLMRELGVSDEKLESIIADLESQPGILAAKISGSGLGDCVIGIGLFTSPQAGEVEIESFTSDSVKLPHSLLSLRKICLSRKVRDDKTVGLLRHPISQITPTNIALIKYWGKRDKKLNLPVTSSLSIALPGLGARTQIFRNNHGDALILNGKVISRHNKFYRRLVAFLDQVRPEPGYHYTVITDSNIPIAAGLASSASGFAALVKALDQHHGWQSDDQALSILARKVSCSACRSLR